MPFETHEEYFATVPTGLRARLTRLQLEVERRIPGAVRCISYNMPAFKQRRIFFYFAAFKTHIGVYPPVTENAELILKIAQFRGPKGNLSFPHDQELPLELIARVAMALAAQYEKK